MDVLSHSPEQEDQHTTRSADVYKSLASPETSQSREFYQRLSAHITEQAQTATEHNRSGSSDALHLARRIADRAAHPELQPALEDEGARHALGMSLRKAADLMMAPDANGEMNFLLSTQDLNPNQTQTVATELVGLFGAHYNEDTTAYESQLFPTVKLYFRPHQRETGFMDIRMSVYRPRHGRA